jgi:hypothetical protein
MIAARLCVAPGVLIVDPPASWDSADAARRCIGAALRGLMYFRACSPRTAARPAEVVPPARGLGMIARSDDTWPGGPRPVAQSPWLWARVLARSGVPGRWTRGERPLGTAPPSYFVICDERLKELADQAHNRFRLLFGFAGARPGSSPC